MEAYMKLIACLLLLTGISATAWAGELESDLQAVIMSPAYGPAAAAAAKAVKEQGSGFVVTLGETSTLKINEPNYFYYIPVFAVKIPLSPTQPKNVGSIVAELEPGLNSPVPSVLGVYFSPAPELP
jgi:hypothetical protein